jgi:hypothetical protein
VASIPPCPDPTKCSVRFGGQPSGTYLSRTERSLAECFGLCWRVEVYGKAGGVEYGEAIIEALSECQIVLLIFSIAADGSPQVRREIERAVSKEKIAGLPEPDPIRARRHIPRCEPESAPKRLVGFSRDSLSELISSVPAIDLYSNTKVTQSRRSIGHRS